MTACPFCIGSLLKAQDSNVEGTCQNKLLFKCQEGERGGQGEPKTSFENTFPMI